VTRKVALALAVIALTALVLGAVGAVTMLYVWPEQLTRLALESERRRAALFRREIELPGGLRYVYLEGGRGEPLMLLHGFGANKDNFVRVARFLTSRYRVIVPDHIGFGESSHPPEADYSPSAQAHRLRALANALGIKTVHLGGSSMGGHIAMTYAALYPTEVASLWLLDPGGVWSAPPGELRKIMVETGTNPLIVRTTDDAARLVRFVMSEPPFILWFVLDVLARERIRNAALEEKIFRQLGEDSVEARVTGLATPTLIVWGDEDRVLNVATAGVLHKLMPRSQVVIMRGVGHVPMIERPRESADDYLRFRAALAAR
jgi:pimeloyl-ACP methyl ester carboxylesterase